MMRAARYRRGAGVAAILWVLVAAGFSVTGRTQHVTLALDDLTGPAFHAHRIVITLSGQAATVDIGALTAGKHSWKNIRLDCRLLQWERARVACDEAVLAAGEKIPLSFSYRTDTRVLDVALKPAADETWKLHLRPGLRGNDISVAVDGGRAQRLAAWLPEGLPKLNAGRLDGVVDYSSSGHMAARLSVTGVGFSDATGLRAGEKIGLSVDARGEAAGGDFNWSATLSWNAGEAFWQPVYLKAANQQLLVAGRADGKQVRVERGALRYPGIGDVAFSGLYDTGSGKILEGLASAQALPLPALYETILKPFLEGTAFSDLRTDGSLSARIVMRQGSLQQADIQFDNMSFEDRTQRRFAVFGVNGAVPWQANAPTQAAVTIKGGELLKMPLGSFAVPLSMNGMRFDLKQLRVPLLDGQIEIRDFVARAGTQSWYWQFTGAVGGISMDRLTAALGMPVMHGTLDATLPMVRHVKSTLRVDGALSLKVFDGAIEAKNLVLLDLFGRAPRVQADVAMRNLDLELVTRAYSFGNMTGRVDANVTGLELVNWQPVRFDARLISSSGNYPRKISQAAVQNISALGGAGAAAAIQRSFLRFFEEFGYEKLGWSCRLQNGVCEMGGVEDAPQGYVIVKGGGIPAITVMGYNRQVNWHELLDRLRRVTQGNVKPVVQ